jgi:hypothetical protein
VPATCRLRAARVARSLRRQRGRPPSPPVNEHVDRPDLRFLEEAKAGTVLQHTADNHDRLSHPSWTGQRRCRERRLTALAVRCRASTARARCCWSAPFSTRPFQTDQLT